MWQGGCVRILVVEDEKPLADAIVRGLRREGMAVDVAYDGDEGHEKASITRYDVIVLDRDLPGSEPRADGLSLPPPLRREVALRRAIVEPELRRVARAGGAGMPEQGDGATVPQSLPGRIRREKCLRPDGCQQNQKCHGHRHEVPASCQSGAGSTAVA